MKFRIAAAALCLTLASHTALAAQDYDKTGKTDAYTLRLRVPAAAMAIAPVKQEIFARWDKAATEFKKDAIEDKTAHPQYFHPHELDTHWRLSFDSAKVISLSAETFWDGGGAHPNTSFNSFVWNKDTGKAVPINALFAKDKAKAGLEAIAHYAMGAWQKIYTKRSGEKPGADMYEMAKQGIQPDAQHLGTYVLIHAKGETKASGLLLLYGAGEVWPHVVGQFLIPVPAHAFARDLAPEWKATFKGG